jgi:hypothetical protein
VLAWLTEAIRRLISDEVSTEHPAEQRCMHRAIRDGPARGGAAGRRGGVSHWRQRGVVTVVVNCGTSMRVLGRCCYSDNLAWIASDFRLKIITLMDFEI